MTTMHDLIQTLGGELIVPAGQAFDHQLALDGLAGLDQAGPRQVTFLSNPDFEKYLPGSKAALIVVPRHYSDCPRPQLVHKNPYWCYARIAQMFWRPPQEVPGVSPEAYVSETAKLGRDVTIYPGAFLGDDCVIGDRAVIYPNVYIGRGVRVGSETVIRANVSIEDGCILGERVLIHSCTTIGADGFGFAPGESEIAKIPQVGIVRISDDVEVGSGCTIDRAAMGETVIGRGSKLDSSVHVAHNVKIGEHTMLCGLSGVAGSAKIGNWVIIAGGARVGDHVEIADRVVVGGLAGVTKDITEAGQYLGFPAGPAKDWRRQQVGLKNLGQIFKKMRELEQKIANLVQKE